MALAVPFALNFEGESLLIFPSISRDDRNLPDAHLQRNRDTPEMVGTGLELAPHPARDSAPNSHPT
jgi:hypothetical protein